METTAVFPKGKVPIRNRGNRGDGGDGGDGGGNDNSSSGDFRSSLEAFINAFYYLFDGYIVVKEIKLTDTESRWRDALYSLLKNKSFIDEVVQKLETKFNENNTYNLGEMVRNVLILELQAVTEQMNNVVKAHNQSVAEYESVGDKFLIALESLKDALEDFPLLKLGVTTWKECVEIFRK